MLNTLHGKGTSVEYMYIDLKCKYTTILHALPAFVFPPASVLQGNACKVG